MPLLLLGELTYILLGCDTEGELILGIKYLNKSDELELHIIRIIVHILCMYLLDWDTDVVERGEYYNSPIVLEFYKKQCTEKISNTTRKENQIDTFDLLSLQPLDCYAQDLYIQGSLLFSFLVNHQRWRNLLQSTNKEKSAIRMKDCESLQTTKLGHDFKINAYPSCSSLSPIYSLHLKSSHQLIWQLSVD